MLKLIPFSAFSCVLQPKDAIRPQDKQGVWHLRKSPFIIGLATAAAVAFTPKDVYGQNNTLAANNTPTTEVEKKKPVISMPIDENGFMLGSGGDATIFSGKNGVLVLYIAKAKDPVNGPDKYTAEQYAAMISNMFKDNGMTKGHPTQVYIVIGESVGNDYVAIIPKSHGYNVLGDKSVAAGNFPQYIPQVAATHAKNNKTASNKPANDGSSASVYVLD